MWRIGILQLLILLSSNPVFARDPFQMGAGVTAKSDVAEHWYPIRHQPVQRVRTLLSNTLGKLTAQENIIADDIRNGLWLRLNPQHWQQAQRYLRHWDAATPQVDIMAYVVDIESNFIDEIGIKWQRSSTQTSKLKNEQLQMNLPNETGLATVHIGLLDRQILALQLSALEQEGHGAIMARPHLLIDDNKVAVIEAGTEIPYSEKTSSGATNASFKKAVLRLKVRPRCLPDHRLLLALEVNHDKVSALNVQGTPAIETQNLTTEVAVSSGQTVVLGGLFTVSQTQKTEALPWLGKLPGIGSLFRWQSHQVARKELLVFISPSIIKPEPSR